MNRALRVLCPFALALSLAVLSGCGTSWVSDQAKEASGVAHSSIKSRERWPESVDWHVGSQKKVGGDLQETGEVSYGCYTQSTLIPIYNGKTTTYIPDTYQVCSQNYKYSLLYDNDGRIIRFNKQ